MAKEIELTNGGITLVDDEDYEWLSEFKWCKLNEYVIRRQEKQIIKMHRSIINAKKGELVDHKNRNKLDNRKENLRITNTYGSSQNRKSYKNSSSQYKGVYFDKRDNTWVCQIRANNKKVFKGIFKTEKAAAAAYNYYVELYHGEYAVLNNVNLNNWKDFQITRIFTSKYRGVRNNKRSNKKWESFINYNGKYLYIGNYKTEIEAAIAHDKKILELNLNKNKLNFPEGL